MREGEGPCAAVSSPCLGDAHLAAVVAVGSVDHRSEAGWSWRTVAGRDEGGRALGSDAVVDWGRIRSAEKRSCSGEASRSRWIRFCAEVERQQVPCSRWHLAAKVDSVAQELVGHLLASAGVTSPYVVAVVAVGCAKCWLVAPRSAPLRCDSARVRSTSLAWHRRPVTSCVASQSHPRTDCLPPPTADHDFASAHVPLPVMTSWADVLASWGVGAEVGCSWG